MSIVIFERDGQPQIKCTPYTLRQNLDKLWEFWDLAIMTSSIPLGPQRRSDPIDFESLVLGIQVVRIVTKRDWTYVTTFDYTNLQISSKSKFLIKSRSSFSRTIKIFKR